ncbi:hypothetical protein L6164_005908 [Bauhinia variegata]|uniref:Uncharacterized protein n=1 Tax=Bauhinia variegata TaxID=167791 RepID=A0ACB9PSR6_BAUVA|nr:hypothetical protein L6164_005908 [Bauhinia variegata]
MGRPPCCDKSNVKRGLWTPEEDAKILAYISNHGTGNWTLVPKKAGLNRCGKSCRLRWTNYLRPDLKHESFTPQEEELIINLHEAIGSRWSLIAKRLPGRTDNDVKNYWNTKLRKKLMKMGIDPVTHKPVSKVISDLGCISGFPSTGNKMGLVNKNLCNMLPTMAEPTVAQHLLGPVNAETKIKPLADQAQSQDQVRSWEHQEQFQVASQDNFQPHVFNEATSSSSSSSSSSNLPRLSSPRSFSYLTSEEQAAPPCSSFDWSEFLLSDPFMCIEPQQHGLQGVLSSLSPSVLMQSEIQCSKKNDNGKKGAASENCGNVACKASLGYQINTSSSGNSFVDDILDRDNEIRAAFPQLLDGYSDY